MSIHKEITFENEICAHLAANGWLHEEGDAERYDRKRALFPSDLIAWIEASQPDAMKTLREKHRSGAEEAVLDRVRKQIDQIGTLDVLRHGIDMVGLRDRLRLAQFRPALTVNPDILNRYEANRLRVIRQLRYSASNENSIDLGLFLNGIPVATAELKTDFTQSVGDAIDQYRFDRNPRAKGRAAEPLLGFSSGALVHFAVSNSEVHMTTKLAGPATRFLPFNQGYDGAAGNPPSKGHQTAYLWEEVWERESWLELIGRYVIGELDRKNQLTGLIFPRYHQLDATRRLVAAVRAEGAGGKYLIQHSAGSGKTNSIAWSAHFLADLHDAAQKKLFDTVIVVSDRKVIDGQLQKAIFSFERTAGVVQTISGDGGSKSGQLAQALKDGIVVCTIQTFPFALQEVQELAATEGKTFAVIADEAHSSQTGQAAAKLKEVLSTEELKDLEDGGEFSTEDLLAAQMAARASNTGITYVAFTATPKSKTLQLFGRPKDVSRPVGPDNLPEAFHVYSMRQAIEEGFILDVLKNYTPYSLALRLADEGREFDDSEVDKDKASKELMQWVRLHPYNISQKVKIIVEHFISNVAGLLDGRAKAMVVVASRKEAVRWKRAIDRYIAEEGYAIGTLVAFSGQVSDADSGPEPFSEASKSLNPDLGGRDIRTAFDTADYQILLVANKFQTGFDQPLLCAMYVDRPLSGIQAVQTLSRLNRAYPGKDTTYVLDFSDSAEEVLRAFRTYYRTAELEDVTDPNVILDLRQKLDGAGYYDAYEVDRVVNVELDPSGTQADLIGAIQPVAQRLLNAHAAARKALKAALDANDDKAEKAAREELAALELFKSDLGAYQRMYSFLSQIFNYANTDFEKRSIFYRRLLPLLEFGREREAVDISKVVLTHHSLRAGDAMAKPLGGEEAEKLKPVSETGSGAVREREKALLAEIISRINDLFDGDFTDGDGVAFVKGIRGKLEENETLSQQASNNTKQQFSSSPDLDTALMDAIVDAYSAHSEMSKQAMNDATVRKALREILLGPAQLYEALASGPAA